MYSQSTSTLCVIFLQVPFCSFISYFCRPCESVKYVCIFSFYILNKHIHAYKAPSHMHMHIHTHTHTYTHDLCTHICMQLCIYLYTEEVKHKKQTLTNIICKSKTTQTSTNAQTQNTYTSMCGNTDSHSSVSSLPEPLDLLLLIIYRQTLLGSEPSAHAQWRWSSRFSRWIGLVATFQNRYSKTDRVFVFLYNTVKVLLLPPASMTTPNGRGYGARKVQEGEVISKDSE